MEDRESKELKTEDKNKKEITDHENEAPEEVRGEVPNIQDTEAFDRISKMEGLLNLDVKEQVSEAVAFNQVSTFMNYYRVNVKNIALAEGPLAVETILNRVIQGIREGNLEMVETDTGVIVTQTIIHSPEKNKLTYGVVKARHKRAMDGKNGDTERMLSFVFALTGIPVKDLAQMQASDMSLMNAVASLFTLV